MPYLRKRGTDDMHLSTPELAARDDMLPVSNEDAQLILKNELSLAGSDFSKTTTEDGRKIITKYLRKHGTNELFLYTDILALRNDMVPTTEEQADKINKGLVDFQKQENVVVDTTQPPPPLNLEEGRVDMTDDPKASIPNAPQVEGATPGTTPPASPEAGQGTGPAGEGQGGPGVETPLSDLKKEQIDKLSSMTKDEMIAFAFTKYQVKVDKRKSNETVREIVTILITDNP